MASMILIWFALFNFQSKVIVGGDALQVFDLCVVADVRIDVPALSLVLPRKSILRYTNLTIQSIQIGSSVIVSIKTLAGCMSSSAIRPEM